MLYKFTISIVVILLVIFVLSQIIAPLFIRDLPFFWVLKDARKGVANAPSDDPIDVADSVLTQVKNESQSRRRRG